MLIPLIWNFKIRPNYCMAIKARNIAFYGGSNRLGWGMRELAKVLWHSTYWFRKVNNKNRTLLSLVGWLPRREHETTSGIMKISVS
jgi:hypothetical protein